LRRKKKERVAEKGHFSQKRAATKCNTTLKARLHGRRYVQVKPIVLEC